MALPVILFNSSTGSDTAASGAGPGTAVTGTAAAHTNGVASTTITLTNTPNLSGVATDGSAALWLKTASGRQFSKITGVDDGLDTVTVEDSFNIAAGSPVDYAIGGKRQTLENADSRTLFGSTGAKAGWIIELETDQTINTPITLTAAGSASVGCITLRGVPSSGETVKIIQTINDDCFDGAIIRWRFERLKFVNTNATKTLANGVRASAASGSHSFYRCIFGDATDRLNQGYSQGVNSAKALIVDCEITECVTAGIGLGAGSAVIVGCYIHDCDNGGIEAGIASDFLTIIKTVIARCDPSESRGGLWITAETNLVLISCVLDDHGLHGVEFSANSVFGMNVILNNQFTNNGDVTGPTGYGLFLNGADVADFKKVVCDWNNFFGNALGARNGISAGDNDLAADPQYGNAASGNFEIGTNTRAEGFPDKARTIGANQSQTTSFVDIGAAQREESLEAPVSGGDAFDQGFD